MSQNQIEKIRNFFGMDKNKERLLTLLKKEGEYLEFSELKGFVYAVKIGEAENSEVMLKVAMRQGRFEILNAFQRPLVSVVTA